MSLTHDPDRRERLENGRLWNRQYRDVDSEWKVVDRLQVWAIP